MIDLIHDTDPRLPEVFNRYGCRYMCLYAIPQIIGKRVLTVKDILDDYEIVKAVPDVFKNANQLHLGSAEQKIINAAFRRLRLPFYGAQIGKIENGKLVRWRWAADEDIYRAAFIIAHWETNGADGHYTLCDMAGNEIYDPHDPEQAGGYVINKKRIMRCLVYGYWEI